MKPLNPSMLVSDNFVSIVDGIQRQIDQFDFDLRCAAPGIIQSFDETKQTVVVQLAIKELIFMDRLQSLPIPQLGDVPIVVPRAGNFVITVPPKKGDECLVVFADTCIDSWWKLGEETGNPNSTGARDPMSVRRHDLSDAFAILGTWSQPKKIETYATDCMEIRTLDGKNKVQIKDDAIKIVVNENTYIEVKDGILNIKTNDTLNVETEGDVTINGGAKYSVTSSGDMTIESTGGKVTVTSDGDTVVNSGGKVDVTSTGAVTVDANSITLGSGTAKKLITDDLINIFNQHTHVYNPGPLGATTTAIPAVQLSTANATTNTEAS
ncbi:MAG: hypothetical protein KA467_00970 [Bacteroidales bacterium]|nr:hypothetical protein [Bacteroidales bacterium]